MSESEDAAIRSLAQKVARTSRETRDQARASQGSFRSVQLTDGPVSYYDDQGVERLVIGAVGEDGEFTIQEVNAPAPPTPTAPDCFPFTAAIAVSWDGTFEESNRPADLNRVEIHASQGSPTFTCDDTTQVGEFRATNGGEFTFSTTNASGIWFFRLVAVNNSEVESDPSAADSAQALSIIQSTDNIVPPQVMNVVVDGLIKSVFLKWDPVVNADPVEYLIYGGSDSGFVLDSNHYVGKTGAPRASVSKVYDNTLGILIDMVPAKQYYFKVVAQDNDGPGPASVEVSGTPVQINSPDIATDAIIARTIKAGAITATKLETILALATTLLIGSEAVQAIKLDATSGLIVKDSGGNTLFQVPLVSGQPIFMRSNLIAESITALGQVSLRDTGDVNFPHELGQGGQFRLNKGVSAPSTQPSWSYNYPQRSTNPYVVPALFAFGADPAGAVLDDAGTSIITGLTFSTPGGDATVMHSTNIATGATANVYTSGSNRRILAMTKISTSVVAGVKKWAVMSYQGGFGSGSVVIHFFDYLWNFVAGSTVNYPYYADVEGDDGQYRNRPGMAWDGTNIHFVQIRKSDYKVIVHRCNAAGVFTSSWDPGILMTSIGAYEGIASTMYHATADYAAPRFFFTVKYLDNVYVLNNAGVRQPNDEWSINPANLSADQDLLFWNAASVPSGRFETYHPVPTGSGNGEITTFGRHMWSSATLNTQRISHAWADGTPNKTVQGSRAVLIGAKKRAYYRVTLPVPPSPATRAYYYWGTGADTTLVTNMWEQGFLSGGATTFDVEVPTLSGTNPVTTTGAIAGATSSRFWSEAVDAFPSANTPLTYFKGDGDARVHNLIIPCGKWSGPLRQTVADANTVNNTAVLMRWATVQFADPTGIITNPNTAINGDGRIVIGADGLYEINCVFTWASSTAGTTRRLNLLKNVGATPIGADSTVQNGAAGTTCQINITDRFVAGDYFTTEVLQVSGGALGIFSSGVAYCSMTVKRIAK